MKSEEQKYEEAIAADKTRNLKKAVKKATREENKRKDQIGGHVVEGEKIQKRGKGRS